MQIPKQSSGARGRIMAKLDRNGIAILRFRTLLVVRTAQLGWIPIMMMTINADSHSAPDCH